MSNIEFAEASLFFKSYKYIYEVHYPDTKVWDKWVINIYNYKKELIKTIEKEYLAGSCFDDFNYMAENYILSALEEIEQKL